MIVLDYWIVVIVQSNAAKRKSMRDRVFRELPGAARQQQDTQKLVLEQPAERSLSVSKPGRISAVIGSKAHVKT